MATALVPHTEPAKAVDWNREIEGARMLLKSGLLPDTVKSPEAALFIILTGRDLGMSPVQSLRSINIIKGKVEVSADAQLGLFHKAGGKSHFVTLTDTDAVLRLSASWLLEPHEETFSLKDAERAGLLAQQPNYKKFPRAMLRSRAITAGLKSVGFDPTAGMYDYGEIGGPEQGPPVEIPLHNEMSVSVSATAEEVEDVSRLSDVDQPVTDDQHTEIKTMLKARGMTRWADVGPFLTKHLGRPEYATVGDYRTIKAALEALPEVAAK